MNLDYATLELLRQSHPAWRLLRSEELKQSIADNGGDRLERLAGEISKKEQERQRREQKAQRYAELARAVGEAPSGMRPAAPLLGPGGSGQDRGS